MGQVAETVKNEPEQEEPTQLTEEQYGMAVQVVRFFEGEQEDLDQFLAHKNYVKP